MISVETRSETGSERMGTRSTSGPETSLLVWPEAAARVEYYNSGHLADRHIYSTDA